MCYREAVTTQSPGLLQPWGNIESSVESCKGSVRVVFAAATWSSLNAYEQGSGALTTTPIEQAIRRRNRVAVETFGAFSQGSRWRDNPGLWNVTASR